MYPSERLVDEICGRWDIPRPFFDSEDDRGEFIVLADRIASLFRDPALERDLIRQPIQEANGRSILDMIRDDAFEDAIEFVDYTQTVAC
jgi:hypothetical protein